MAVNGREVLQMYFTSHFFSWPRDASLPLCFEVFDGLKHREEGVNCTVIIVF